MPRGDLFSILSSKLSATFLVSFIMHLMSLSSGISPTSSLGQSSRSFARIQTRIHTQQFVILGISVIISPESMFKLISMNLGRD